MSKKSTVANSVRQGPEGSEDAEAKAKAEADAKQAEADAAKVEADAKQAEADPKANGVVVAKGHSITTKRGLLGEGTEVFPRDFPNEERVDELFEAGVLASKPKPRR